MQYFEILLLVLSSIYLLFSKPIQNKVSKKIILGLLLAVLVLHLMIEGSRWQMIPAYILWGMAFASVFRQQSDSPSRMVIVFKKMIIVILLIPGVIFPVLFPVFDLPTPTGSYLVGTRDLVLHLDRDEVITPDPKDKRTLVIKVFYPSNAKDGIQDPYIDERGRHGFAMKYGLPKGTFNYLDKIDTHVYRDADILQEIFPVLIFSHGYNSKANGYYAILSELASQGYVIFALNHTYESTGSTLVDGK